MSPTLTAVLMHYSNDVASLVQQKPLYEGSRVVSLNRERDSFADVRRKRVDEYGKEIRDSKIGV